MTSGGNHHVPLQGAFSLLTQKGVWITQANTSFERGEVEILSQLTSPYFFYYSCFSGKIWRDRELPEVPVGLWFLQAEDKAQDVPLPGQMGHCIRSESTPYNLSTLGRRYQIAEAACFSYWKTIPDILSTYSRSSKKMYYIQDIKCHETHGNKQAPSSISLLSIHTHPDPGEDLLHCSLFE